MIFCMGVLDFACSLDLIFSMRIWSVCEMLILETFCNAFKPLPFCCVPFGKVHRMKAVN